MAHPSKAEGVRGHNAKLRKYTEEYGAADPKMYKTAPVDRLKQNGPEDAVGYGAEDGTATARGDRPARKSSAANPVATYKSGGRVRKRQDGGVMNLLRREQASDAITDRAQRAIMDQALREGANADIRALAMGKNLTEQEGRALRNLQTRGRADGGRLEGEMGAPGGMLGRSSGRARKSASTNVNIIVAPQSPPVQPPMPPLVAGGPPPGMGPGGPGAGAGGPPGGPGGPGPLAGLGGPGGLPPGATPPGLPQLPRKRGGRVHPFSKKEHPDEAEDQALVKDMVKPSALKRAVGGRMTAGAESGPGRLEKTANRARRQKGDKSAEC